MKFLSSQILFLLQNRRTRRNIRSLAKFILLLSLFITAYSLLFHVIMGYEGREFSLITAPVLILGGGRVGRAAAATLREQGVA